MKKTIACLSLYVLLICSRSAAAALTIEITQGVEGALPIAIIPFDERNNARPPPQDVAGIVADDLRRSGRFAPVAEQNLVSKPVEAKQIRFGDWRTLGVESLVIGRVETVAADRYRLQFQLFDVYRGRQLAGFSLPTTGARMRHDAHRISDIIYEKLTGQRGAFATRIAYITVEKKGKTQEHRLQIADADGYNPQTILTSPEPLMSPAWSPDGRRLAYVSFERRRAAVYVQEVATGQRRKLIAFAGINGAPAWSPDGSRLAVTLSRDGDPEIYVYRLADGRLQRLTRNTAIDTEPAWSPDGASLVFTSDRGGSPQLYRIPAQGGRPERLSFEGNYNASADFSPDGKRLALVHGAGGQYRIGVLELETGLFRVLTDGRLDESPSFAPNGSIIIYATAAGARGVLAAVSSDGRFRQRLSLQTGDVREPAWSPFESGVGPE